MTEVNTPSVKEDVYLHPLWSAYTLAFLVLTFDQLTKLLVEYYLRTPGTRVEVLPYLDFFNLVFIRNPGGAWGILRGYWYLFVTAAVVALGLCTWFLHSFPNRQLRFPVALVLGGAAGNLTDRLFLTGGVVDFFDFGIYTWRWPAFNIADAALSISLIWLLKIFFLSKNAESLD